MRIKKLYSDSLIHAAMSRWQGFVVGDDLNTSTNITATKAVMNGYTLRDDTNKFSTNSTVLHVDMVLPHNTTIDGTTNSLVTAKPMLVAYGTVNDNAVHNTSYLMTSSSGHMWHTTQSVFMATNQFSNLIPNQMEANGDLTNIVLFGSVGNTDIFKSVDSLSTFTQQTVFPSGFGLGVLHKSKASNRMLAGIVGGASNSQRIYTSDNNGTSWTARTTPVGFNFDNVYAICSNEHGHILAASAGGGSGSGLLMVSTDNGNTWGTTSPAALTPQGYSTLQMAWSTQYQNFIVMNANLQTAFSVDGSTWNTRATTHSTSYSHILLDSNNNVPGAYDRGRNLVSIGPVTCLAASTVAANTGLIRTGVFYTIDNGVNWYFSDFGETKASLNTVTVLRGAAVYGNRIMVYGHGCIWISDPVVDPPSLGDLQYLSDYPFIPG